MQLVRAPLEAYPHITLAVDNEQHSGAKPDEVLPPQSKLFSVKEDCEYLTQLQLDGRKKRRCRSYSRVF